MASVRPKKIGQRAVRVAGGGPVLSRYDLYELCVQNPRALAPLLLAIHGGDPLTLGEDFCGSAALSRHWLTLGPRCRAVAVDADPEPLERARALTRRAGGGRLSLVHANVLRPTPGARAPVDVLFVGNFSIGEIHARRDLVRYLRLARARLRRGGVFVCDTYGGQTAFVRGAVQRIHPGPAGEPDLRVRYTWQQREADPLTGLVENALHFRVQRAGEVILELTDAFVYRWRLWSVPELRDAMREAGFEQTDVYAQLPDARDASGKHYARAIQSADELDESFIVCVAAR